MIKKTILLLIFSVILTSCVPYKQLEELGIINTRGVDVTENNRVETTIIAYQFDAQNPQITTSTTGVGKTIKGARENAGYNTNFELSPGQIRLELYGKETAEEGILEYLSTLVRDARVSDTMLVAISNITANEVLTVGQEELNTDVGQIIQSLIEKEVKEYSIPKTSLQHFLHIEADIGQDPVAPIIGLRNNKPAIVGIGAFSNDKLVGELHIDQAFLINTFLTNVKGTPMEVSLPREPFLDFIFNNETNSMQPDKLEDKEHLTILVRISKGKGNITLKNIDDLHFEANVHLEVDLYETSELLSVKNEKIAAILEEEIEKEFMRQYDELLAKLQEMDSDPLGFGGIYRTKKKGERLTDTEWREKYTDITVDFNVNVDLMHYGTIQ
ncbi:Ger(x)C family spore germination protein [Oceanobacillus profundus]|uniref:Ger(x)C family spore germination protein n=1 Tax=Oceanobacillus profundus TaxID=372463 RepID=UPI000BA7C3EE|nr:Ger(x)C family spore germination C-terminal domain-containing protein [Oceanobacillus profundus]MBR3118545.1 Ger(x)C family spore germination protein [Oceanobacillus sp.]MCM3399357.1 Ger(x)C family spore germination protein [Oceanobacillus profundus]PAE29322.1 hypothetical protein CHI07_09190 [Paenibacillus sp. 7884-2]